VPRHPARAAGALGAVALAASAAALACSNAHAVQDADPAATALAKTLKAQMQQSVSAKIPGIRFTTVTCTLVKSHKRGHCVARFTIASQRVKGAYQVSITVNTVTGTVHSHATSVACTDVKTGARVRC
jgi:hypothetical protein